MRFYSVKTNLHNNSLILSIGTILKIQHKVKLPLTVTVGTGTATVNQEGRKCVEKQNYCVRGGENFFRHSGDVDLPEHTVLACERWPRSRYISPFLEL